MAKQNDYGWVAWLLGIGAGLFALSRLNSTSDTSAGATSIQSDEAAQAATAAAQDQASTYTVELDGRWPDKGSPTYLGPPVKVGDAYKLPGRDPYQSPDWVPPIHLPIWDLKPPHKTGAGQMEDTQPQPYNPFNPTS